VLAIALAASGGKRRGQDAGPAAAGYGLGGVGDLSMEFVDTVVQLPGPGARMEL
jgi:hypothetical protein